MDGDHVKIDFKSNNVSRGITIKWIAMTLVANDMQKSQPLDCSKDLSALSFVGAAFVIEFSRVLEKKAVMQIARRVC